MEHQSRSTDEGERTGEEPEEAEVIDCNIFKGVRTSVAPGVGTSRMEALVGETAAAEKEAAIALASAGEGGAGVERGDTALKSSNGAR